MYLLRRIHLEHNIIKLSYLQQIHGVVDIKNYIDTPSEEETTMVHTYQHVKVCHKPSSYYIDVPSEE